MNSRIRLAKKQGEDLGDFENRAVFGHLPARLFAKRLGDGIFPRSDQIGFAIAGVRSRGSTWSATSLTHR